MSMLSPAVILHATALVLGREFGLDVQFLCSVEDKVGASQEGTADGNQVGFLLLKDFVGLLASSDQANSNNLETRDLLLDSLSKGNLVVGSSVDDLLGRVAARRDVEDINSSLLDPLCNLDSLLNLPGRCVQVLNIIGGRDSEEDGLLSREVGTDFTDDLEQEAGTVLERSSVLVDALVGNGREELVNQVSVSAVNLDGVETSLVGTSSGGSKGLDSLFNVLKGELAGDMVVGIPLEIGSTAGCDDVVLPVGGLRQVSVVCLDGCLCGLINGFGGWVGRLVS